MPPYIRPLCDVIRTKSNKLEYPLFPDQPTSYHFFDEAQFAACRDLGYNIANE